MCTKGPISGPRVKLAAELVKPLGLLFPWRRCQNKCSEWRINPMCLVKYKLRRCLPNLKKYIAMKSPLSLHHTQKTPFPQLSTVHGSVVMIFSQILIVTFYSENARVCAKWQWNALDCVTGLHDRRSRECNPVTPVECVSLSFRTHTCVLAFITHIMCTNGIEMALV